MRRLLCRVYGHRWAVEWTYSADDVIIGVDTAVCIRCKEAFT